MTRFARAHGSTASNTRVPEEATSWSVMRQQIDETKLNNKDKDDNRSKDRHDSESNHSNKRSMIDDKSASEKVWEDFGNRNLYALNQNHHNNKSTGNKSNNLPEKFCKKITPTRNCKITKSAKIKGNSSVISDQSVKTNTIDESTTDVSFSTNTTINQSMAEVKRNSLDCKRKKIIKSSVTVNDIQLDSDHATERKQFKNDPTNNIDKLNGITNKKLKWNNSGDQASYNPSDQASYNPSGFVKEHSFEMNTKERTAKLSGFVKENSSEINAKERSAKPSDFVKNKSFALNTKNRMAKLSWFQGYQVKKEDADKLYKLQEDMRANGIPRKTAFATLSAERRKAEKALAREKKGGVCYKCRQSGHIMADCPELDDSSGICYKCGSTEHSSKTCRVVKGDLFKFTHCFICQEQGHIARQCPDNPSGLYPKGGACKKCGAVTHFAINCPQLVNKKESNIITVETVNNNCIEDLGEEVVKSNNNNHNHKKNNVIKF